MDFLSMILFLLLLFWFLLRLCFYYVFHPVRESSITLGRISVREFLLWILLLVLLKIAPPALELWFLFVILLLILLKITPSLLESSIMIIEKEEADSWLYEAFRWLESSKTEAVLQSSQKSLAIYRVIGDSISEAFCLDFVRVVGLRVGSGGDIEVAAHTGD